MMVQTGKWNGKQRISTKRLVVAALLMAITVFLAYSPIGMIPLPPPLTNATTVHIPVLLGVIVEGPWLGLLLGLTFGVCSLLIALNSPAISLTFFFRDPLVSILPRLLFPLIAWCVYMLWQRLVKRSKATDRLGIAVAATVGSLMNTVLCLGAIIVLHGAGLNEMVNNFIALGGASNLYLDQAGAWLVAVVGLPYGISEAIVAALLVPIITTALDAINRRGRGAKRPAQAGTDKAAPNAAVQTASAPLDTAVEPDAMPAAAMAAAQSAVENAALAEAAQGNENS